MDNFLDLGLGNYAILEYITNKRLVSPIFDGLWKLYFDGACSRNGAGIIVLIESPDSKMKPHSYRLEFEYTNNEAEYEALIQRLELAKYMNIKCFSIFGDSKSVVNQVKIIHGIEKCRIKVYVKKLWDLINHFYAFNITFNEREKNHCADSFVVTTSMFTPRDLEMRNTFMVLTLYKIVVPDN